MNLSALSDAELDRLLAEGLGLEPTRWRYGYICDGEWSHQESTDLGVLRADHAEDVAAEWGPTPIVAVVDPYSTDPAASARLRAAVLEKHGLWPAVLRQGSSFCCYLQRVEGEIIFNSVVLSLEFHFASTTRYWAATETRAVAEAVMAWLLAEGKAELP